MQRYISLTVGTRMPEEHYQLHQELSELARNLTASHEYVSVIDSKVDYTELPEITGEDLYYDENTISKVRQALRNTLEIRANYISDDLITDMINSMQNAGIYFRESK